MTVLDIAKYNAIATQYKVVISFLMGWAFASAGLYTFHYLMRKKPPPILDWIIVGVVYTLVQVW